MKKGSHVFGGDKKKKRKFVTLIVIGNILGVYLMNRIGPHSFRRQQQRPPEDVHGPEYINPPRAEVVTNPVFDIPKLAEVVQCDTLDRGSEVDGGQPRRTESLYGISHVKHPPIPKIMPYADYTSYYPNQGAYIDPTQIQPWLPLMEPPLFLRQ
ncbi:hypothetical protein BYT27DRAFT_7282293 [Phlegmacium glaucopus]|nr:hypothetical protein BYT27DRAFT_7282293 [Phlegmacium glaucopus]